MFYLLSNYTQDFSFFNLFRYITFRTGGAVATALLISFIFGPAIIRWLKSKQGQGQPLRDDSLDNHKKKVGTPTMGGLMILIATGVSTLLWMNPSNEYTWILLFVTLGFGFIGFIDDYKKLVDNCSVGVPGKIRFFAECLLALVAVCFITHFAAEDTAYAVAIPFVKGYMLQLGWFFIPFAMLVIVGASNSVNLTDGLDGLAIVPVIIVALCFIIISYLVGNAVFADYLQINNVKGAGELTVFCGALVGAGLGFLWFNAPPAKIFMGDTGSLALGAALGSIAVIVKHEIVLAIIGGIFVFETLSVILQIASYKFLGRRLFRMAPIHHHFEKMGWSESTIVIRFWIVACILGLIGLATLKLR